jgi:hypothetical protein
MDSRLVVALVARLGFMALLLVSVVVGFLQWGSPVGVVAFILGAVFLVLYVVVRLMSRVLIRKLSAPETGEDRAG